MREQLLGGGKTYTQFPALKKYRPYGCAPLQGGKFWESPVEPAGLESVSKTSLSTIASRDPKGNAQIYENNNFPQQLIFP